MPKQGKTNKRVRIVKLEHSSKNVKFRKSVLRLEYADVKLKRIGLNVPKKIEKKVSKKNNILKSARRKKKFKKEKMMKPQTGKIKEVAEKNDWVMLDAKQGADFVLKNSKTMTGLFSLPREQRAVFGIPEGGKSEGWNFIKIYKNSSKGKDEVKEYILNDHDTLEENNYFEYNFNSNKYVSSPYILNLKDDIKTENNRHLSVKIKFLIEAARSLITHFNAYKDKARNLKILQCLNQDIKLDHFLVPFKDFCLSVRLLCRRGQEGIAEINSPVFHADSSLAAVSTFVVTALLLILPFLCFKYYVQTNNIKGEVLGASVKGLYNLKIGKDLLSLSEIDGAKEKFIEAEVNFKTAKEALSEINTFGHNIGFILADKEKEIKSAKALLEAGEKAAEISSIILQGFDEIDLAQRLNFEAEEENSRNLIFNSINLAKAADEFNVTLKKAAPKVSELKLVLDQIDIEKVPLEYQEQFNSIKDSLFLISERINDYVIYSDILADFMAKNSEKRYLLIFQNNNEIRPTGGFIGSYALMDVKDGKILNIEMPGEGSYYLQGGLLENIIPPRPLSVVNSRWEFHDSNWWPDFPVSARTIGAIYEKSGGPTVDGIVAVNSSLMEELFRIIGPISMPDYDKVINSNNFVSETQKAVELEYDKDENKPKQILVDLMPKILEKIFNSDKQAFINILSVFSKSLKTRDLQLYANDAGLENKIIVSGWGGEIKDIRNRDYLLIAEANLGGRKTDSVIEKIIVHNTDIMNDGTIINELTITRKHNGIKGDYFTGVNNVDYIRIYVPEGSELIDAWGFNPPPETAYKENRENAVKRDFLDRSVELDEKIDLNSGTIVGKSFNKTYFANWTQVKPGETASIYFKYKLPFNAISGEIGKYSLYIQKQSGSYADKIEKELIYPKNLNVLWAYPGLPEGGNWITDKLETDRFYGAIFTN